MVRLLSFQYLPRGSNGWESERLDFGKISTIIRGPNGSGKTPLMKGIMLALGHEIEIPTEISTNCKAAEITLEAEGEIVTLVRSLPGEPFAMSVSHESNLSRFDSLKDFSEWFIGLIGAEAPALTTKGRAVTPLYLNTLYPILWVNQDQGWASAYWTPPFRDFIVDQRQEVLRFVLGLPPRHPYRSRNDFDAAKKKLERLNGAVELQQFVVAKLQRSVDISSGAESSLRERRRDLQDKLKQNEGMLESIRAISSAFDQEITQAEEIRQALAQERRAITSRMEQVNLVLHEIESEIEVLAANVQAADLLRQFCKRDDCALFNRSEESYGRALLFMKDQLKDLKTTDSYLVSAINLLDVRSGAAGEALQTARDRKQKAIQMSPHAQVMATIQGRANALVEVELGLARIEQFRVESAKLERLIDRREQAISLVENLRPRARPPGANASVDVREKLSKSMTEWLKVLNTQNVSGEVVVDEGFSVLVGGARFDSNSSHSGSTRTRIVLAFHAAVLEVALDVGGNHPGWLLLDAPLQHELHQRDFNAYFDRMRDISSRCPTGVQVVFSVVDLAAPTGRGNVVWSPQFGTKDKPRYLLAKENR